MRRTRRREAAPCLLCSDGSQCGRCAQSHQPPPPAPRSWHWRGAASITCPPPPRKKDGERLHAARPLRLKLLFPLVQPMLLLLLVQRYRQRSRRQRVRSSESRTKPSAPRPPGISGPPAVPCHPCPRRHKGAAARSVPASRQQTARQATLLLLRPSLLLFLSSICARGGGTRGKRRGGAGAGRPGGVTPRTLAASLSGPAPERQT